MWRALMHIITKNANRKVGSGANKSRQVQFVVHNILQVLSIRIKLVLGDILS